ncbi:MAG: 2,3-diphosphoglycerate synthetase, partial [Thermoleophilia bacterium]|nr:2,3-diphosphoglycerate synthetase [Thermoleophilia bacterium]
ALIDGEHYPPVVVDALRELSERFEFRAALFLGGTEKIKAGDVESEARALYGLPVVFDADRSRGLARVLAGFLPEVVVDLSDEPVLGYEQRFRLISECLARNVGYVGSDFHFSPATSDRLCTSPSLSIIGTGKRVGKTAVSGFVARAIQDIVGGHGESPGVVVVAMGRGGPAEPELVAGAGAGVSMADLLARSRAGRHAASDHFEDAVLSRVTTIGCRRCGGGMAGEPFVSNVAAGVELANSLNPGMVVLEGSGAAMPPVGVDARLLVAGAHQPLEHITGYLGMYRLLVSDALVLTMAEEPQVPTEKVQAVVERVGEIRPEMPVVPVVFRPRPLESVEGRRVAFFSTAPPVQEGVLRRHLEREFGCRVEFLSTHLADRAALGADLAGPEMSRVEVVLTEIKAAAIDVVAEEAALRGLPVVPVDNVPVEASAESRGRLAEVVEELVESAKQRFESRA